MPVSAEAISRPPSPGPAASSAIITVPTVQRGVALGPGAANITLLQAATLISDARGPYRVTGSGRVTAGILSDVQACWLRMWSWGCNQAIVIRKNYDR